jgi:hypothetical protein
MTVTPESNSAGNPDGVAAITGTHRDWPARQVIGPDVLFADASDARKGDW